MLYNLLVTKIYSFKEFFKMKEFGLQAYSVRDHFDTEENLVAAFKELKSMGYSHIQTALFHTYPAAFLKKAADEAGITFCGTHYIWDRICSDVDLTVAEHKTLGTKYIGIGGVFGETFNTVESTEEFIAKFNEIAKIYSKYGFVLTYHNHSHEFKKLEDGKTVFDHLIEGFDPETTAFVLDTYWVQHGGADVRATIERLNGRIAILHLKDMEACHRTTYNVVEVVDGQPEIKKVTVSAPAITEVGQGNINFKDIIPLAEKCGVKYFVVEDDRAPSTGDSYRAVKKSADYIKANLLNL